MALKILLAEDEDDVGQQLLSGLKELGNLVYLTKNGEECLHIYRQAIIKSMQNPNLTPFDILVIDYDMPKKNGVELAKEILEDNPKQRIVFLTGHGNIVLSKLGEYENVELFTKPISTIFLASKIEGVSPETIVERMQKKFRQK